MCSLKCYRVVQRGCARTLFSWAGWTGRPSVGGSNGASYIYVASLKHITYLACREKDLNNEEKYSETCLKLDLGKVKQSSP